MTQVRDYTGHRKHVSDFHKGRWQKSETDRKSFSCDLSCLVKKKKKYGLKWQHFQGGNVSFMALTNLNEFILKTVSSDSD